MSILEVSNELVEVLSTNGDTHLGGDDFDEVLIHHIAAQFQKDNGIDLRKDAMALQRLREAAEKAKKELSTLQNSEINLPFCRYPNSIEMESARSLLPDSLE